MKTKTLGILNVVYGVICCFLFLIQSGVIVFRSFTENGQYTLEFVQAWQVVMFVLILLSIVLFILNIKRKVKGNKKLFYVLNGCIVVNIVGSVAFLAVAIFSFVIVVLGVVLWLKPGKEQDQLIPVVSLKKRWYR